MSNTNTLYSSSQVIQVASGENYTLKDDEVCINNFIYKKVDIEIITDDLLTNSLPNKVKIGITKRDGSRNIPATPIPFNKWQIDGVYQTTLENCINNITAFIKPVIAINTAVSLQNVLDTDGYAQNTSGSSYLDLFLGLTDSYIDINISNDDTNASTITVDPSNSGLGTTDGTNFTEFQTGATNIQMQRTSENTKTIKFYIKEPQLVGQTNISLPNDLPIGNYEVAMRSDIPTVTPQSLNDAATVGNTITQDVIIDGFRKELTVQDLANNDKTQVEANRITITEISTNEKILLAPGLLELTNGTSSTTLRNDNADQSKVIQLTSEGGVVSLISDVTTAPTSNTDIGKKGEVRVVGNTRYECISDDTWISMTVTTTF